MTSTDGRQDGFTLIEILISLAVTLILLLAVLAVVQSSGRVSRLETETAAMNQGQRASHRLIARDVRMTGRGGLPANFVGGAPHRAPSFDLRNNVGNDGVSAEIAIGRTGSPTAVTGTDILAVRGVFDTPLYQISPGTVDFTVAGDRKSGTIRVRNVNPAGQAQDLSPLVAAVNGKLNHALVLKSPLGGRVYSVVELDWAGSSISATDVVLAFRTTGTLGGDYGMLTDSPGELPPGLETLSSVGILEEHRFYLRDTEPPTLSVATVYPNTNVPVGDLNTNLARDVADGVIDFQVALGFDSAFGGSFDQDNNYVGVDDEILETDDGANDDWLFNAADDDPTAAQWTGAVPPGLYYIRFSTVGRTASREFDYRDRPIAAVEDNAYGEATVPATEANRVERMFRRSLRSTLVDLRNL